MKGVVLVMNQQKQLKLTRPQQLPTLRLTPTAWAKLLYLRDAGNTEIGGFGIAAADDLLLIEDVSLVDQSCTAVAVEFDDTAVANFFDEQVDCGRRPEEFGRVWIHTHPGSSAQPSGTDEETFARVFGGTDWAVMFILARGGQTYGRLRYHLGPGVDVQLPVEIDYSRPFEGSDHAGWQAEYDRCVQEVIPVVSRRKPSPLELAAGVGTADEWPDEQWSAGDGFVENWSAEDWPADDWYNAWRDYVDPSDFPKEAADVCHHDC